MLQSNNKSQNKSLGIIIVALLFMSFTNMESTLKTYAQEKVANPSLELTAKLVKSEYKWLGSNNATNPTLNITSGVDNQIIIRV